MKQQTTKEKKTKKVKYWILLEKNSRLPFFSTYKPLIYLTKSAAQLDTTRPDGLIVPCTITYDL